MNLRAPKIVFNSDSATSEVEVFYQFQKSLFIVVMWAYCTQFLICQFWYNGSHSNSIRGAHSGLTRVSLNFIILSEPRMKSSCGSFTNYVDKQGEGFSQMPTFYIQDVSYWNGFLKGKIILLKTWSYFLWLLLQNGNSKQCKFIFEKIKKIRFFKIFFFLLLIDSG